MSAQRLGRAADKFWTTLAWAKDTGADLAKNVGMMELNVVSLTVLTRLVVEGMLEGRIESTVVPRNALDVLAQQVVAMCAMDEWRVDDLARVVRRAYPYSELGPRAFESVLDMLSGRFPSDEFAELRP